MFITMSQILPIIFNVLFDIFYICSILAYIIYYLFYQYYVPLLKQVEALSFKYNHLIKDLPTIKIESILLNNNYPINLTKRV